MENRENADEGNAFDHEAFPSAERRASFLLLPLFAVGRGGYSPQVGGLRVKPPLHRVPTYAHVWAFFLFWLGLVPGNFHD